MQPTSTGFDTSVSRRTFVAAGGAAAAAAIAASGVSGAHAEEAAG